MFTDIPLHDVGPIVDDLRSGGGLNHRWPVALSAQSCWSPLDFANNVCFHANVLSDLPQNHTPVLKPQSFRREPPRTTNELRHSPPQPNSYLSLVPHTSDASNNIREKNDAEHLDQIYTSKYTSLDPSIHAQPTLWTSFPAGKVRNQSSQEFDRDLVKNIYETENEVIFAQWCWGFGEPHLYRPGHENSVQNATDPSFTSSTDCASFAWSEPVNQVIFPPLNGLRRESGQANTATLRWADANDFNMLKTGLSVSHRERSDTWPSLRTRTNVISRDLFSMNGALSFENSRNKQQSLAAVRPRREKLTITQKRRNHILQEKKRRTMIKDGFDDLINLVPGLKDQNLSKSSILFKAAEWLTILTSGNKALRTQALVIEETWEPEATNKSATLSIDFRGKNGVQFTFWTDYATGRYPMRMIKAGRRVEY